MGVTTILLDDGETAVMTDGFFSRPGWQTFHALKPDETRIGDALSRGGVAGLAAVMTAHSHHDHAMDSPEVARRTGALLIGSKSTANIARGVNFPEDRICEIGGGETFTFGHFRVTVIRSQHSPAGPLTKRLTMGHITKPLRPPASVVAYKEGGSYSYLIEHGGRRILIHPSANYYRPDFLRGVRADIIFLSVGNLGNQSDTFAKAYWQHVVKAAGAKVVVPIHWDDFTRPLDDKPLRQTPRPFDNVGKGLRTISRLAEDDGVTVRMLEPFKPVDVSELSR